MFITIKEQFKEYLSVGAKQSGIVLAGDITAKAITFAITIIVMNSVTPDEYFVFGLFITVLVIVAQLADLGLSQSFIRFYSLYSETNPARSKAYLHFTFRVKICLLFIVGVLLFFFSSSIAEYLTYPQLTGGLRLLSFGIIGVGLFEYFQAMYQARQDFKMLTILRVSEAALKILFIGAFILQTAFSITAIYQAYTFVPVAIALLVIVFSKQLRVSAQYDWKNIFRELYPFNKWLVITSFATIFLQNMDTLMISRILADVPTESGIYYAGKKLCQPLTVVSASISTVFFPKAMALNSVDGLKKYVKRTLQVSVPISIGTVLYVVLLYFIVPIAFPDYKSAIPIVFVLYIGWIWTIVLNPITMLMLSLNKANVAMWVSLVQLIATALSHYLLMTHYGGMGAAVSNVLMWFLAGTFSIWYIYKHRHKIETVTRVDAE